MPSVSKGMDRVFRIEPLANSDREEVQTIFESNVPRYFSPEERARFVTFLRDTPGPAWVARTATGLVGFGALSFSDQDTAWLRWGMVHRDFHRRGGREGPPGCSP